MIRTLLSIIFCSTLLFGAPFVQSSYGAVELIDNDYSAVSVSLTGNSLHVVGAAGQMLYVYNVAGVCVSSFKVEGNDKHFDLNIRRGCYIVKVGKIVRKISIS